MGGGIRTNQPTPANNNHINIFLRKEQRGRIACPHRARKNVGISLFVWSGSREWWNRVNELTSEWSVSVWVRSELKPLFPILKFHQPSIAISSIKGDRRIGSLSLVTCSRRIGLLWVWIIGIRLTSPKLRLEQTRLGRVLRLWYWCAWLKVMKVLKVPR